MRLTAFSYRANHIEELSKIFRKILNSDSQLESAAAPCEKDLFQASSGLKIFKDAAESFFWHCSSCGFLCKERSGNYGMF